jgi:hypothetical protein
MSNRIYSKPRNPDWLAKLIRAVHRKRWHISQDWQCTKIHWRNAREALVAKALRLINAHYMTITVCFVAALFLFVGLVALQYIELWVLMR